jgi:hypothetical protein
LPDAIPVNNEIFVDLLQNRRSQSVSLEEAFSELDNDHISSPVKHTRQKQKKTKQFHWKPIYAKTYTWLKYDDKSKTARCMYEACEKYITPLILCLTYYRSWRFPCFEPKNFIQHAGTQKHKKHSRELPAGQQPFRSLAALKLTDDAIWTRIQGVWWLIKEDIAIHKFPSHLEATLVKNGLMPPKTYKDEHFAWEVVELLGDYFRKDLRVRLQKSSYFGITADETTDNSVDQQLIIYVKYLDHLDGRYIPTISFLDLVSPKSGSAEDIKVFL